MKKNLLLVSTLLLVTMFTSCVKQVPNSPEPIAPNELAAPSIDSISSASVTNYYEKSGLTKEQLLEELKLGAKKSGTTVVATTNADGTPNLAVVVPGMADENTLVFSLAPNQTRINFNERKLAVLSYYIYDPEAPEKNRPKQRVPCYFAIGGRQSTN